MTIRVINNSGIGNRLKNIVSAIRKGHHVGDVVEISGEYSGLFQVAQCVLVPVIDHVEVMSTWSLVLGQEESDRGILKAPRNIAVYHDRETYGLLGNTIDFQYFNIKEWVVEDFLRYFSLIIFDHEILSTVNRLDAEWQVRDKVGVHIRTWFDAPDRHHNLFDIEDFFLILDSLADSESFFLCVDHDVARQAVVARYGSRRVLEPIGREIGHVALDTRDRVAFSALVDMLLLSCCKKIIGTYQSTFSECAWWFGGARQLIEIPIPKKIVELEKYLMEN